MTLLKLLLVYSSQDFTEDTLASHPGSSILLAIASIMLLFFLISLKLIKLPKIYESNVNGVCIFRNQSYFPGTALVGNSNVNAIRSEG